MPAFDNNEIEPILRRLGSHRVLAEGHTLIQQGEHDQSLFYLLSGVVEVVRDGVRLKSLTKGDIVGEYAFLDNRPRTASVLTRSAVEVLALRRQDLLSALGQNLGALSQFLSVLSAQKSVREQQWQSRQSAHEWVQQLLRLALSHRAVNHPYLKALASGKLPDLRWALADFARQYYGYSAHFPRFLTQTISQLTEPVDRAALMSNLTEERGIYEQEELDELAAVGVDPDWIVGIPHPQLFSRFSRAMGVELGEPTSDAIQVISWREMFLDVLSGGQAQAIGALGLGTESIVSTMYQNFLPALDQLDIPPRDAVFFPLHAMVDDRHQETLMEIATRLAESEQGRRDLEKGMHKALFLRAGFWDWLLGRAANPDALRGEFG